MNALLLLLLDSRAPTGSSSHSAGLEAAVTAGWVSDLDDVAEFCAARLQTGGRVAAAFAAESAAACRSTRFGTGLVAAARADEAAAGEPKTWWRDLDEQFDARTPSEAMRSASRQLGIGLRRTMRALLPDFAELDEAWGPISPHHPIVLGAGCALTGATPADAARAAALSVITTPATAAVRLLGLDPYAVHAVLARLAPQVDDIAILFGGDLGPSNEYRENRDLPADSALALELLADVHRQQEVRLFAS